LNELRVDPHGEFNDRNAYYRRHPNNYLTFGSFIRHGNTFVNAAQDADIIWHEHAHAIQWNLGVGNMSDQRDQAVLEGSSDYWATSYKRHLYPNNNWARVALWFTMADSGQSRITNLTWPPPFPYGPHEVHLLGQRWSSALMKIWGDLGRDTTDQLFLETHLIWGQAPTMRSAAAAFMQADVHLYDGVNLCQILHRFKEYDLIDASNIGVVTKVFNTDVTSDTTVTYCGNILARDMTVSNNATLTLEVPYNIILQDVIIENGSNLILEAGGKVTFGTGFKVELGGRLEMR
jgi:hypothetical protein